LVHRPDFSSSSVPTTRRGDLNPDTSKVWHLQSNIRASANEALHEVVWTDVDDSKLNAWKETGSGDGRGFVRLLQPGDKIAVIARARASRRLLTLNFGSLLVFFPVSRMGELRSES
jgi:hypothetical protein